MLERLGVYSLGHYITRRMPRVLMYHRFAACTSHQRIGVDAFEQQILYLRKHFRLMTMGDLARRAGSGAVPERAAVITVDDGYSDFFIYAWPILRKYGVPATLYAVTNFISGSQWLWPDEIRYIVICGQPRAFQVCTAACIIDIDLRDEQMREASWRRLATHCLQLSNSGRREFIERVARTVGVEVPVTPTADYKAMTWEQLSSLAREGVEIGSHTVTHPRLTQIPLVEAWKELTHSKAEIERNIGVSVRSFCYPNGERDDYDERIVELVRLSGYESATVTLKPGMGEVNVYEVGRIAAQDSMPQFRRSVSGLRQLASALSWKVGSNGRYH